jgi:hypothetical protein
LSEEIITHFAAKTRQNAAKLRQNAANRQILVIDAVIALV